MTPYLIKFRNLNIHSLKINIVRLNKITGAILLYLEPKTVKPSIVFLKKKHAKAWNFAR